MIPKAAINERGAVVAVWRQFDGTHHNAWSNRYGLGAGWREATLIENENLGDAELPRVAIDAAGNAIAVWRQNDGVRSNIMSNRLAGEAGWAAAELIETSSVDATQPDVTMSAGGSAIAVWAQGGIRANHFEVATGLSGPQQIASDGSTPRVAVDSAGNALAIWTQSDGVWAGRFMAGAGWTSPEQLDETAGTDLHIVMDGNGNGRAAWVDDGAPYLLKTRVFSVDIGWGPLDTLGGNTSQMAMTVGAAGHAAVAHSTFSDTGPILVQQYVPGGDWSSEEEISVPNSHEEKLGPMLALDRQGNALAFWHQFPVGGQTPSQVFSRRFVAGQGWGEAAQLRSVAGGDDRAHRPFIVTNTRGIAVALWLEHDGTRDNVFARIFR